MGSGLLPVGLARIGLLCDGASNLTETDGRDARVPFVVRPGRWTLRFRYLADRPEAAETVARWYLEEWGYLHEGANLARVLERVRRYLNRGVMPYILLVTEGDAIMGAAQLKYREMEETFPDYEHWLGGVYVAPEYRGRSLGSALADEVARRAPDCGVRTLYLQTERLDGGLYRRLGWVPITRVRVRGPEVLVMRREVGGDGDDSR